MKVCHQWLLPSIHMLVVTSELFVKLFDKLFSWHYRLIGKLFPKGFPWVFQLQSHLYQLCHCQFFWARLSVIAMFALWGLVFPFIACHGSCDLGHRRQVTCKTDQIMDNIIRVSKHLNCYVERWYMLQDHFYQRLHTWLPTDVSHSWAKHRLPASTLWKQQSWTYMLFATKHQTGHPCWWFFPSCACPSGHLECQNETQKSCTCCFLPRDWEWTTLALSSRHSSDQNHPGTWSQMGSSNFHHGPASAWKVPQSPVEHGTGRTGALARCYKRHVVFRNSCCIGKQCHMTMSSLWVAHHGLERACLTRHSPCMHTCHVDSEALAGGYIICSPLALMQVDECSSPI